MRTEPPNPLAPALGWLRSRLTALRDALGLRATTARWGLAILALVALLAGAYFVAPSEPAESEWIYAGHKFTPDEVVKITSALVAGKIDSKTDQQGRIAVPGSQLGEALAVLQKQKLEPRSTGDILSQANETHMLDIPFVQEQRRNRAVEESFESMIRKLDSVRSANVFINRVRARGFGQESSVSALVNLDAEQGQLVPPATVATIQNMLLGGVPGLKADAITVVDSQSRSYLVAGNPHLGMESRARAREVELTSDLKARLDWIDGVRVFVKLDKPAAANAATASSGSARDSAQASTMVANAPLDAEPKPSAEQRPAHPGRARVIIQVPISHYIDGFKRAAPNHEPTQENLRPYVEKTERSIRNAVAQLIPESELAELQINHIVLASPSGPVTVAAHADPHRPFSWWLPIMASAVLAMLALAGGRMIIGRRPATQAVFRSGEKRYGVDEGHGAGPGPSERVRDLVRRNPEAAAGVLQRWIGQGGDTR